MNKKGSTVGKQKGKTATGSDKRKRLLGKKKAKSSTNKNFHERVKLANVFPSAPTADEAQVFTLGHYVLNDETEHNNMKQDNYEETALSSRKPKLDDEVTSSGMSLLRYSEDEVGTLDTFSQSRQEDESNQSKSRAKVKAKSSTKNKFHERVKVTNVLPSDATVDEAPMFTLSHYARPDVAKKESQRTKQKKKTKTNTKKNFYAPVKLGNIMPPAATEAEPDQKYQQDTGKKDKSKRSKNKKKPKSSVKKNFHAPIKVANIFTPDSNGDDTQLLTLAHHFRQDASGKKDATI